MDKLKKFLPIGAIALGITAVIKLVQKYISPMAESAEMSVMSVSEQIASTPAPVMEAAKEAPRAVADSVVATGANKVAEEMAVHAPEIAGEGMNETAKVAMGTFADETARDSGRMAIDHFAGQAPTFMDKFKAFLASDTALWFLMGAFTAIILMIIFDRIRRK